MLSAGKSVGGVLQQLGVSEPTYHRWRNQYGGMKAEEAKRLKQLEQENVRLKKLVVEQALDRPWIDWDKLRAGVRRRNEIVHDGTLFDSSVCLQDVASVEEQLVAWAII